ncbi:PQQ-binding-like beta-propeller repeat protein [Fuerstiella marisgermanici]|uniref:Outer membrane protein assembly factor BamB n=1 Tax=Fuerstiella marisgermanici TaxID=1891926 RepID=A0A1P8WFU9_9PLAN|nr:PQQ-binding-like beta-propeller repeat protein [Fuerstiella marisgermanici]APZ92936.1 Outer membrane protein assembly factor BamB precursor [Fuerstiella marisgermanici]
MKLAATLLLLLPLASFAEDADSWPQWRGPNRDCQLSPRAWPASLSADRLKRTFRVPLGSSYSGPIVANDRVFVTETVDKTEIVRALDRATGSEIWKVQWPGSMTVPFFAAANGSWIRSTPAHADGRLFVASMEDVMVGLDAADGREIWRKDFRKEFGTKNQSFGFACSPLVDEGHVYVQTAGGLVKLSGETGEVVWRSLEERGGMMAGAFSSPIIAEIAAVRQLVVQTRSKLAGVSLDSGQELWSVPVPAFRGMNILTPTVIGDQIFTSSYGGGSIMFRVSRDGDAFTAAALWKGKNEAYMSSPVVVDGYIYLHLRNQRVICVDPCSGKALWTTKPFGKYWSMVVNGSNVLALDERGDLLLLDLNTKEFVRVDSRHVSDSSTWAHLAVVGNQVFVRELNGLLAFEWNLEKSEVTAK